MSLLQRFFNSFSWTKIEKNIGSLKAAVILISTITLIMIIGTFVESYYGTNFAGRLIYKSIPFMILQFFLFLSITFATFLRLPFKRKLSGFYIIHLGLILIGVGSFITYYSGIDGSMTLTKNNPNRTVLLSEDQLVISRPTASKKVFYTLPNNAFTTNLNDQYGPITIKKYLPFSENKFKWITPSFNNHIGPAYHSSQYHIKSNEVDQSFVFSLHPQAKDFGAQMDFNGFSFIYLPEQLIKCFTSNNRSSFVAWDSLSMSCQTSKIKKLKFTTDSSNRRMTRVKFKNKTLQFFPDHIPYPVASDFSSLAQYPLRILTKEFFNSKQNILLFGKTVAYKQSGTWQIKQLFPNKSLSLPWMDLKLNTHSNTQIPFFIPKYILPRQQSGRIIVGNQKALLLEIGAREYWITNGSSTTVTVNGEKYIFELSKTNLNLPFEFNLTRFKMEKSPGTNMPASYESFVRLFTAEGLEHHHIYMNHPLKKDSLTFYQSSYFKTRDGSFGSILSVNIDPGRGIKYFGSLLLVLGAILHYVIIRKRKKILELK